jgi:hypothetical protein
MEGFLIVEPLIEATTCRIGAANAVPPVATTSARLDTTSAGQGRKCLRAWQACGRCGTPARGVSPRRRTGGDRAKGSPPSQTGTVGRSTSSNRYDEAYLRDSGGQVD